jgi:hypothetical protein
MPGWGVDPQVVLGISAAVVLLINLLRNDPHIPKRSAGSSV